MSATLKSRTIIGLICIVATMCFAQSASAAGLPAPDILSGPLEGQTISTDSASFLFDYADDLTGGTLVGYLCSVDGAPAVACNANHDIGGLSAGVHTLGVKATILPLAGQPLCILTICVTLPAVAVDTDVLTRTFNVDLTGAGVGTDPTGSGGGGSGGNSTAHNSSNSNVTNANDRLAAFALAWGKYKRQQTKCTQIKKSVKRYKSHANRMRAAKRYKKCVKTQKKLRAAALALPR
jgi:hypothetical protein